MERKTKIVATMGPACRSEKVFLKMASNLDIVRLNFSWGAHEEMAEMIQTIRKVGKNLGKKILILQDLSGPRAQEENGHHFNKGKTGTITEKDLRDLKFGEEQGVDYVAMSYVGNAEDILNLRKHMKDSGLAVPIIAKIERREAVENIKEIINVSDGVMIARGDLGETFPFEEVPFIEQRIISLCQKQDKFVIVATEMLTSMMENERPTRAEVTDIAYAISNGANAVMLSDETARGKYPVKAIEAMDRIARYAEGQHPL